MLFMLLVFGVPYLLHRLVSVASDAPMAAPQTVDKAVTHQPPPDKTNADTSAKEYEFARALYPFTSGGENELSLNKSELMMVLEKPEGDWWRGRLQNGSVGWVPKAYLELLEKKIRVPEASSKTRLSPPAEPIRTEDFTYTK